MAWYAWYQVEGGEEQWHLTLAEDRERLIRDKQPQFTTILDADNNFKGEMTSEDMEKVHYRGPLYFDFDASSLEEVIPQFKKFLRKLSDEHEFDLTQAYLYASGGKGFHCIIPQQCFLPKPNPKGYMHLPLIYKEIALECYVDTLDLRVYTARRGRQFRTANVKRPSGKYKVPITLQEAMEMTEEMYKEFTSAPRHVAPPSPPTLNSALALLFSSAHDKVEKALKNRKKSKVDQKLLAKFGGDVPPSLLKIMQGEAVADGVGFQKIATQLSITAHALGKSEEQFLTLCAGLCDTHQSDGTRYNTPEKRRQELRRMYQYMRDNPCYEFSVGGIKSLVAAGVKTPDLDNGGVDLGEDEDEEQPGEDGGEPLEWSLTHGMKVTSKGIFKKTEEGLVKVCAIGLTNPCQLIDVSNERVIGYEVDVHLDGKHKGRHVLDMGTFLSRARFMQFTLSVGGSSMTATDPQVGAVADILRSRAHRTGNQVYTTGREGLDVILLPGGDLDVVWADRFKVRSRNEATYRLVGSMTAEGEYKTDLANSPFLEDTPEAREFFKHLFHINTPEVLGRLFGWYLASFFNQPIRHIFDKFPILQVFGPAGSGKTETNHLFAHMHYWRAKPRMESIMEITPFAVEALVTGSGSVPLILDEFKPREMRKDRLDKARGIIRTNYNGGNISKGRLSSESGASRTDVRSFSNTAPIVFLGEAIESQSAIMDRCVMVSMSKDGKRGHVGDFEYVKAYREVMSAFGRNCMESALKVNFDKLREEIVRNVKAISEAVGDRAEDNNRPVFNMAVVLAGLAFGTRVMSRVFGTAFDEDFERLRTSVISRTESLIPRVMSEASKVLDTLAFLSRATEAERDALAYGTDYLVDNGHLEIRLRNCYTKYVRFKRSLGEEVLYDNVEAFITAMSMYSPLTDSQCIDSLLKDSATTKVFQFSLEQLTAEGVGEFKS